MSHSNKNKMIGKANFKLTNQNKKTSNQNNP